MLPPHCLHFLFILFQVKGIERGQTELKVLLEQICFKQACHQQKQIKKGAKSLKGEKRMALVHQPAHLVQELPLGQFTAPLH